MPPHICDDCGRDFKQKCRLESHKKRKTPCKKIEQPKPTSTVDIENKLYVGDNMEVLKSINDGSIDLVVTSPPYDELRTYKGNYKLDLT